MNAFLNLFGIIFDIFRVYIDLYSAILRVVVVDAISVVTRLVVVVLISLTWLEQMLMPIFI